MKKKRHIEWEERAGVAVNVRRHLPALVSDYYTHVRALLAADLPPDKMHKLRLETKRLRYTLELFRNCYGPGFEPRIAALRKVQTALGQINDSVASRDLLSKAMKRSSQRTRVRSFLDGQAAAQAEEFRKLWTTEFDALGQESSWTAYLARNARAPGKPKP